MWTCFSLWVILALFDIIQKSLFLLFISPRFTSQALIEILSSLPVRFSCLRIGSNINVFKVIDIDKPLLDFLFSFFGLTLQLHWVLRFFDRVNQSKGSSVILHGTRFYSKRIFLNAQKMDANRANEMVDTDSSPYLVAPGNKEVVAVSPVNYFLKAL